MIPMLIEPSAIDTFCQMRKDPIGPDATNHRIYEAGVLHSDYASPVILLDSTAVMPIIGPIDYKQSIWSALGFMVSSQAVREDFRRLMGDEQIKRIVFDIDSPGGLYSGLPELARDVFASRGVKQTVAVANPLAASGALWLGAAAEKFFTLSSGQVGSLGALMMHSDMSRFFDEKGITNTILRDPAGKADFNPYEPLSDASRAHHQAIITEITNEFEASMARFRGVTKGTAASDFGQGRVLSARNAVQAGLVDGMVDSLQAVLGPRVKSSRRQAKLSPKLAILTRGRATA